MPRRPGSSRSHSTDVSKSKRLKTGHIPPFSTTEYLRNIEVGDKFVSIIGYVDSIQQTKIKQKYPSKNVESSNPDLDLFKFIVNNNDGMRVLCYSWGDEAISLSTKIEHNHIICLRNTTAKPSSSYNTGNVHFELQMKPYSKADSFGIFQVPAEIMTCTFSEIPFKTGIIKIKGYVKDEFVQPAKNRPDEYIGTITDGEFKIEIVLRNVTSFSPISAGQRLQIIGDVRKNDFHFYLQVNTFKSVMILDDSAMPLHKLLMINKMLPVPSEPP